MAAGKKESLFATKAEAQEPEPMERVENPPAAEGGEKPVPRDAGADHIQSLADLHKAHEAERRDMHGNHRDELRKMHERHLKQLKEAHGRMRGEGGDAKEAE